MTNEEIKSLREHAYGMSIGNLNPDDVVDYMTIASACARMESRRAAHDLTGSSPKQVQIARAGRRPDEEENQQP
jgi:hypothetical protein